MTNDQNKATAIRVRTTVAATVVILAGLDLVVKSWALAALVDGRSVNLQFIELRLAFNSGIAFGLGSTIPTGVVIGFTGLIVIAVGIFAWRRTPVASPPSQMALATILAGHSESH